jgi:DNA-binding NarL/FixJ family response regulator
LRTASAVRSDFGEQVGCRTVLGEDVLMSKRGGAARTSEFEFRGGRYAVVSFPIGHGALERLSPAEREVAQLVVSGRSNEQIAEQRGTSIYTVGNQVCSILRKLGVASRFELIAALGR